MLAVGSKELEGQPKIKKGQKVQCPGCDGKHPVRLGKDMDTGKETMSLQFVHCPVTGSDYIVGIMGSRLPPLKKKSRQGTGEEVE